MSDHDVPQYEAVVDGEADWHTDSDYAEYDMTHFVAGALLAGADSIEIEKMDGDDEDEEDDDE